MSPNHTPIFPSLIQPVHSEGDQPWDFFGRTDAEAETPVLWPPHAKSWLIGKDSDAGRDWGQEDKGTTEDEMAGWHHGLDGHESEWTPGVGDRQGDLACCDSWGHRESDMTEWLNWTELTDIASDLVYFQRRLSGANLKVKASLTSSQVPLPSSPQREPPTASLSAHRLSPAISRWPFPLTLTLQTTNLVNTAVNCCIGFKHIQGIYFNQFLQ